MLRNELVNCGIIFTKDDEKFGSSNKDFLNAIVTVCFSVYG